MKRDINLFLYDIIEAINDILESVKSLSKEEFLDNKDVKDANIRRLEIIGEAVKNIPISFREKYPDTPWNKIAGTRDIITHGYFIIDLDAVWKVIKKDLPKLKKQIKKIKGELALK
jgi:uncharacterized protein with HEPN domain